MSFDEIFDRTAGVYLNFYNNMRTFTCTGIGKRVNTS